MLQLLLGATSDPTVLCTGKALFKILASKSVHRAENGQFEGLKCQAKPSKADLTGEPSLKIVLCHLSTGNFFPVWAATPEGSLAVLCQQKEGAGPPKQGQTPWDRQQDHPGWNLAKAQLNVQFLPHS